MSLPDIQLLDPLDLLVKAQIAALKASANVRFLVGDPARVHDVVPADPVYPFIRIGAGFSVPVGVGCGQAWQCETRLISETRPVEDDTLKGSRQARLIAAAAAEAIVGPDQDTAPFVLEQFTLQSWRRLQITPLNSTDGASIRAVLVCTYLVSL